VGIAAALAVGVAVAVDHRAEEQRQHGQTDDFKCDHLYVSRFKFLRIS
jgi:hypothetical protein